MSVYAIAEHHGVHTCPVEAGPHSVHVTRRIINARPGRACQNPVTIRVGQRTAVIPCGRHEPLARQCGACRTLVTITQVTATDLGPAPLGMPPAPTGLAPDPCPTCRRPVAAILTRHVLCPPPRTRHAA